MRALVVTGDDFGFSRGVNRAVIEAHDGGILTHASLMVTGPAASEAIALARSRPTLQVGLHLVIVDGRAALAPTEIPRLVDSNGCFRSDPFSAGLLYQFSRRARRELEREIREQLALFQKTGLTLSHVDGHHHMHLHPVVLDMLCESAREFSIPRVRLPSEELGLALSLDRKNVFGKALTSAVFALLHRRSSKKLRARGIVFPERVYGLLATGTVTQDYLGRLIPRIRSDFVEIYSHPALELPGEPRNGPEGAGPRELEAVRSPRILEALARAGFLPEKTSERRATSGS